MTKSILGRIDPEFLQTLHAFRDEGELLIFRHFGKFGQSRQDDSVPPDRLPFGNPDSGFLARILQLIEFFAKIAGNGETDEPRSRLTLGSRFHYGHSCVRDSKF